MSEPAEKRPQFGNRHLGEDDDVFAHNAWDDIEISPEYEEEARKKVAEQATKAVPDDEKGQYNQHPDQFWDSFYMQHENRFFKDRNWLFTEFPELLNLSELACPPSAPVAALAASSGEAASLDPAAAPPPVDESEGAVEKSAVPEAEGIDFKDTAQRWARSAHATRRILEVGCGAGNTVFPLLAKNPDPALFVYACDFAPTAVRVVRGNEAYDPQRCHAFVCDMEKDEIGLPEESLDVIVLIFVLSALHPDYFQSAVSKLAKCLKPGGVMLFRDYGRHDLAQLRFGGGRYLSENFYIRGDGTRVYFFTTEEMKTIMETAGLEELQNRYDRRLLVNRKRRIAMQRIWVQVKYRKPLK